MRRLLLRLYRELSGRPFPPAHHFRNSGELRSRFDLLRFEVPPRARRGRQHQQLKEWHLLRRYLLLLETAGRLEYPLAVAKSERPDFRFRWPDGRTMGLEVTEATTPAFQQELTHSADSVSLRYLDTDGWSGDELERALSSLVREAALAKLERMARPGWLFADRHDLLLYNNGPYLLAAPERLLPLLREALEALREISLPAGPLGTVSLLTGSHLLYDILGEASLLVEAPPRG